ncbi:MAG: methyltransferase [Pseudomonadota bacterium]
MKNPKHILERLLTGYQVTQLIYVAAKLGIPDLLKGGPRSSSALARAVGAHPKSLYRVLRTLSVLGIFSEKPNAHFALTRLSRLLTKNNPESLRPLIVSYGESWWWQAYGRTMDAVRTGKPAFRRVHGMGFFDFLSKNPQAASVFQANMSATASEEARAVLKIYDFTHVNLLIDVGGGHGTFVSEILKAHPPLRAILVEHPSVLAQARKYLKKAGIERRCDLVSGDFFKSIPRKGDLYTLKDIVHDWDNDRAIAILRTCRRAMPDNAKLLLIERVIKKRRPPLDHVLVDISMLVLTGGMERTDAQYRALLKAAGFRTTRILPTTVGASVIEAVPSPSGMKTFRS